MRKSKFNTLYESIMSDVKQPVISENIFGKTVIAVSPVFSILSRFGVGKTIGATAGSVAGTAVAATFGIPPTAGKALGSTIGGWMGKVADEEREQQKEQAKVAADELTDPELANTVNSSDVVDTTNQPEGEKQVSNATKKICEKVLSIIQKNNVDNVEKNDEEKYQEFTDIFVDSSEDVDLSPEEATNLTEEPTFKEVVMGLIFDKLAKDKIKNINTVA